ncbi:Cytochrome b561 and DOMON domain-containing protein, partial [Cucurbita argyrosperma subsp. argyrosperma]
MAVSNSSSNKLLLSLFCFISIIIGFQLKASAQSDGDTSGTCNSNLKNVLPSPYSQLSSLACSPIWERKFSFSFFEDGKNVMTFVLSGKHVHKWIGIGFSRDGLMEGSSAVVAWVERNGVSGIRQYYLGGKNTSKVIPDKGDLRFTSVSPVVVVRGDLIYIAFQLQFATSVADQYILLAIGSGNPLENGLLPKHINKTTTLIELSSGKKTAPNVQRRYHGLTAIIGWGIITPSGLMIARYFRHIKPIWYYLHSSVQFVGFFVGIISISIGRNLYEKTDFPNPTHRFVGYTAFFLAGLEVCQFIGRPSLDSKRRPYWNFAHYWVGRAAMVIAVSNICIGFHGNRTDNQDLKIGFAMALVTLLTVMIILETRLRRENAIPKTIVDQPPVFRVVDEH